MLPFQKIFTKASTTTINKYAEPLTRLMAEYKINTPLRQAHFLSQLAHESCELGYTEENLKYSASRLVQVFPKYFKSAAQAYAAAYNPERIANIVYANRMGNGNEQSGDGYTFRGRGLIQLTGRNNYESYVKHLRAIGPLYLDAQSIVIIQGGTPSHPYPDPAATIAPLLSQPEHAVRTACWFWQSNGLNEIADRGATDDVVKQITRKINGGTNGLSQRFVYFYRAHVVLRNM